MSQLHAANYGKSLRKAALNQAVGDLVQESLARGGRSRIKKTTYANVAQGLHEVGVEISTVHCGRESQDLWSGQ